MRRCFGWAMILAIGILLGGALNSHQSTNAEPPADADAATNADALAELKEIKAQLKEVNSFLRTGVVRVFVNMNPPTDNGNKTDDSNK
jgi:hypothetical protein